jgi:hypothetical protein
VRTLHLLLLLITLFWAPISFSYPDLVRHGYVNCNTCHTSHSGGDLLTPYGRSLNKEILASPFSFVKIEEGNQNPDKPWLQWGFNSKLLQSFVENSASSKARFMIMQVQADVLMSYQDILDFYVSIGRQESSKPEPKPQDYIYLPEFWVRSNSYINVKEEDPLSLQIKIGKFTPAYGLKFQEHTFVVRRDLGFAPGNEKFNLEAMAQYQNHEWTASKLWSSSLIDKQNQDEGYLIRYAYLFNEHLKIGINAYRTQDKNYLGLFALRGLEKNKYLLMEVDQKINSQNEKGYLETLKFGREFTKGIQGFIIQEYENLQIERTNPHIESYGVGVHYFPSPYLNLEALYKKEKNTGVMYEFQNIMWLVGHLSF